MVVPLVRKLVCLSGVRVLLGWLRGCCHRAMGKDPSSVHGVHCRCARAWLAAWLSQTMSNARSSHVRVVQGRLAVKGGSYAVELNPRAT